MASFGTLNTLHFGIEVKNQITDQTYTTFKDNHLLSSNLLPKIKSLPPVNSSPDASQ